MSATLSANQKVAALTVRNTGADAATVQLQAMSWSQSGGKDVFAPASDILATPPIFTVPAGASQVIRVGTRGVPDALQERAYRLFLREVPPAPKAGAKGLHMVLEISLPVFIQPSLAIAPELHWQARRIDAGHVKITASNTGTAHAHLSRLVLTDGDAKRLPIPTNPVYILPDSSHEWTIEAAVAEGSHLALSMDSANQSLEIDLAVSGP